MTAVAAAVDDAPTLFAFGDLPLYLACGLDPLLLLRLPYTARHAAAAEPNPYRVLAWIEQAADDPGFRLPHPRLDDYERRVREWRTSKPSLAWAASTSAAGESVVVRAASAAKTGEPGIPSLAQSRSASPTPPTPCAPLRAVPEGER